MSLFRNFYGKLIPEAIAPHLDNSPISTAMIPSQKDIDGAYAAKIYLDYHPFRQVSISLLVEYTGLPEVRLKEAFFYQFQVSLEHYTQRLLARN